MTAVQASYWLWGLWYASWWLAAALAARVKARPRGDGGFVDRLLTGSGVILLFFLPGSSTRAMLTLWDAPAWLSFIWLGGVVLGFTFCWWARLHLGQLWSGFVTVKADHRIVDTGSYGIVRHLIYAGVIFAAFCEALLKATLPALLGAALIAVGFRMTAAKEERFLRLQLGADTYDGYARRVRMLVPLLP